MKDGNMGHRPEVAIALAQPLWIETKIPGSDEGEGITGYAIAVGWDRPQETTFYLVSDTKLARPVWVPEQDIASNSIRPPGR
jgi:hypothetical protein